MLTLTNSDLFETFESHENAFLVHCCNCFHTMGAGVAKEVRRRYPAAYRADLLTEYGDPKKLGSYSFADLDPRVVFNLYAQFRYGGVRDLDMEALSRGLSKIANCAAEQNERGVKTPIVTYKIGCGLAGGDWEEVVEILDSISVDFDVQIIVADKNLKVRAP